MSTITITYNNLLPKIRKNLSIIGKRTKAQNGSVMFTDITTTSTEDPIFEDLINFACEQIVSDLSDVCTGYVETSEDKVEITLLSDNLKTEDLESVVGGIVKNYAYNFCLWKYLSMNYGAMGETYSQTCALLIQNIKRVCFNRKAEGAGENSYGKLSMT